MDERREIVDLLDRCETHARALEVQANRINNVRTFDRLMGKAEGLRLAVSYIRETEQLSALPPLGSDERPYDRGREES